MLPHETLAILHDSGQDCFSVSSHSGVSPRTLMSIEKITAIIQSDQSHLAARLPLKDVERSICFFQYGDFAHYDIRSLAFGQMAGGMPIVNLIPDFYFLNSQGYRATRELAESGSLPRWEDRLSIIFWRGSPTCRRLQEDGTPLTKIGQIPRVKLCEALVKDPRADACITGSLGLMWSHDDETQFFRERNILSPRIPMIEHARYKYQIDIDGVANAWSFFDKLLMGSCILKVSSPYKQWFYDSIQPWVHFVPVQNDLSDLAEKIEWCFTNEKEAQQIGQNGQIFARSFTYNATIELIGSSFRDCLIPI